MVSHNTHGNICFLIDAIAYIANVANFSNYRGENIRIVVRCFALNSHTQTFEAHACVDYFGRKFFQRTIRFAVKLHEYVVPDFDYLWMRFVHEG